MDKSKILGMIDHTILKAEATDEEIQKVCEEAKTFGTACVCVHGAYVAMVKELLKGSKVKTASVTGFPYGAQTTAAKVFEAERAIKDGAVEIDMVMSVGKAKSGDWDYVYEDILAVRGACKDIVLKVIFETCLLTKEEIEKACDVSVKAGADFVKTSTGFSTAGATVENVALMKKCVGDRAQVKAAGGIRDLAAAEAMIGAGASRLGTSATRKIAEG